MLPHCVLVVMPVVMSPSAGGNASSENLTAVGFSSSLCSGKEHKQTTYRASQTTLVSQSQLKGQTVLLKDLSNCISKISTDGGCRAFLGNLFHSSAVLLRKLLLLITCLTLSCFNICRCHSFLLPHVTLQSLALP